MTTRARATLVGRTAELAHLETYVARADHGGRLLMVAGEAGVGKTSLIDAFAAAAASSVTVVRGRADEHELVALGLWFGPLTQLDLPRPGSDDSVPANERRWEVVDWLVSALRRPEPTVVVLDDLHWADDDSLWVLEQLVDRLFDAPVSIVGATRPSAEARSVRWHGVYRRAEVMALSGLDVGEVAELARRIGATPADAEQLWHRTRGNPLFVRELAMNATEAATTVGDLLGAAIERAGTDVAAIVSLLAIAGAGTPHDILAAAAAMGPEELDALLDGARRADLVCDDEGPLRLRHDLLVDAASRRCSPGDQRRLHAALAGAWAARREATSAAQAARHALLAVPIIDASVAGSTALAAAEKLGHDGRAADAGALLHLAGTVLDGADVGSELRARVALAEAEARWAIDDIDAAIGASERAVAHAAEAGDPVLAAQAEVAALGHHDPTLPDPVRIARLADLDDALPAEHDEVDPTLRIRLRGRRAVLLTGLPDRFEEACALGDDSVSRARSTGDPALVVRALMDRLFVLATPTDYDARDAAAEEITELAGASGQPGLALYGHEWRFAAHLGAGDVPAAIAALVDLEALAAIMPSPYWRWVAALRRCCVLSLLGDYEGAMALVERTRRMATGVAPELEAAGIEHSLRFSSAALYGREDHGGEEVHLALGEAGRDAPLLFVQARLALAEAVLGDGASAIRRLGPWVGRLGTALRGLEGLSTLGVLAHTAELVQWSPVAHELRVLLRPFAGRLAGGNGAILDLSVDHHVAALALLDGELEDAIGYSSSALAMARRTQAPVLEARALALLAEVTDRAGDSAAAASARDAAVALAEPIGMRLPGTVAPSPRRRGAAPGARVDDVGTVTLHLDNGRWFIASPFGTAHVADSLGFGQLVRLVTAPGTELPAVELAGASRGGQVVVHSDLGPALDARAKREYRRRITELRAEVDEAEEHNDLERAAKHRLELDALLDELRSAVGLGNRDRPQGSGNERARINVSRSLRRSIAAIAAALPELGAHLDVSVRTGHHCSYAPEPAARLVWRVEP